MRISDWSSDVCSSDLVPIANPLNREPIWVGILEGDTGSCRPNCPAPVMSFISPSNGARERMNVTWMSKHGFKARPQPRPFRLLFPPEKITGGPAHSQGERNGCESIKNRPFVSGFGDKALEAGFVNLDLPHRSGEHAAVLNQKGFGGISANDNPRRQRQTCAIEDAIRNFHRSRLFDIKAIASTQID